MPIDFSDLGGVPVDNVPAAEAKAAESSGKAIDFSDLGGKRLSAQPLPSFQAPAQEPGAAVDFLKQVANKAAGGLRLANQLRSRAAMSLLPKEAQEAAQPSEQELLAPTAEVQPKTLAGRAGALTGEMIEPLSLVAGMGGEKAALYAAEKVPGLFMSQAERVAADSGLIAARQQLNREAAFQSTSKIAQDALRRSAVAGAGQGLAAGALAGAEEASDQNKQGLDAASQIVKRSLGGGAVGLGLGAGIGQLKAFGIKKLANEVPEAISVMNTPAQEELSSQLNKLASERAELQGQLRPSSPEEAQDALSGAVSERKGLLNTLSKQNLSQDKINEIQGKLLANTERHALLSQASDEMGFRGAKNPEANWAVNDGISRAQQQYNKTQILVDKGILTPEQAQVVGQAEFNNALEVQGIKPALYKSSNFQKFSNDAERWSVAGAKTGTDVGQVALKSAWVQNQLPNEVEPLLAAQNKISAPLKAKGWTPDQITTALQYMESGGFNPAAKSSPSMTRAAWPLPNLPSAEEQASLGQLRQLYNGLHQEAVQAGVLRPDQLVEGYVPIRSAEGLPQGMGGRSVPGLLSPRFAEQRASGELIPGVHELDSDRLFSRYAKEVKAAKLYAPVIDQGVAEIQKLRLLGQDAVADDFNKYLKETFNLKTEMPLEQLFGQRAVNSKLAQVQPLLSQAAVPQSVMDQLYQSATSSMYKNSVLQNPKTILLHWLQPETMLPAEVGLKGYAQARIQALTSGAREEVKHLMRFATRGELPELNALVGSNPTNPAAKLVKGLGDISESLGLTKPFKVGESLKRYTSLIAGKNMFEDAYAKGGFTQVQKAISNFLPSEQAVISKAFETGGPKAGADATALVVDRRTNFIYNKADRTEILRTGLGNYVPFTSFFRNIIARYQGDLQSGNYAQFTKRAVAQIGAWQTFEALTGKDMSDMNPGRQLKRAAGDMSVAPVVTKPLQALQKGGDPLSMAAGIAKDVGIGALPSNIYNNVQKSGNPFGLKPRPAGSWTDRLFK